MSRKEFKTKAYPIILEAILRATNGDNVQILVGSCGELQEAINMVSTIVSETDVTTLGYSKIALSNNAVVNISLNKQDGYNATLEIV